MGHREDWSIPEDPKQTDGGAQPVCEYRQMLGTVSDSYFSQTLVIQCFEIFSSDVSVLQLLIE